MIAASFGATKRLQTVFIFVPSQMNNWFILDIVGTGFRADVIVAMEC